MAPCRGHRGSGKLTLYVDGVAVGSAPVPLEEIGGIFTIGSAGGARFLNGDVDEVEVSKIARSADWIKAAARSQGMDSNLVLYGADGQKEASRRAPTSSRSPRISPSTAGW